MASIRSLFSPKEGSARKVSFSPTNGGRRSIGFKMKKNAQADVDVVRLQKELSDLRKRVKILDGNTGRNELLDKLKECEEENERAEHQLRSLNDKFHQVHKGLVQIDEERQKLCQVKNQLEREKQDIQRQLDVREKEVLLLAKRCSSQEEKMKERSMLRVSNNELANEMEGLRSSLTLREEELSQIDSLKRELKGCQDSREELLDRLAKVKKDHDDVAETLNSCFQDMQKMNEEKAEVEEERKREMQRAQLELEKQRLAHLDATNELRAQVQLKRERIEQMERILKESAATCTRLRKEKAEWNRIMQQEISKVQEEQAAERAALNSENDRAIENLHNEYAEMLSELRSKLEEKDGIVTGLEDEVSKCMQKMMAIASDLQRLQEERRDDESKHSGALEKAEVERRELEDLLCNRDKEISQLSETISTLESEKGSLSTQLADLLERVKELEEENAFIMDLEDQLQEVNTSVVEVQEQRYLDAEEHEMMVALLQQELEDDRQMWASMEQGLQERISSLEEEKRLTQKAREGALAEASTVVRSLGVSCKTTEQALLVCLEELQSERLARGAAEEEVASLQRMLTETQATHTNERATADVLKEELAEAREASNRLSRSLEERLSKVKAEYDAARQLHDMEMESNKQTMEFKESALASLQSELRQVRETHKVEGGRIQEQLEEGEKEILTLRTQLSDARIALGKEATASQRILSEKDDTIASLLEQISSIKNESEQRERALSEAEAQHEEALASVKEKLESVTENLEASNLQHERYEEEAKRKDEALTTLTAELETLRLIADQNIAKGNEQLSEQASVLSVVESELKATRETAENDAAASRQALMAKEEELSLLKEELKDLKIESQRNATTGREKEQQLAVLRSELEETRMESERASQSLKDIVTEKKETLASLREYLVAKEEALVSLEKQLNEMHETSQMLQAASTDELEEKNETIATLKAELTEAQGALERITVESSEAQARNEETVSELTAELAFVRSDGDRASSVSKEELRQRDTVIQSLRGEVDALRKDAAAERLTLTEDLQIKEDSIALLKSALVEVKSASERDLDALKAEIAEKNDTISGLNTEVNSMRELRDSDASVQQKRLDAKDELVSRMQSEMDDLRSRFDNDTKSFREQSVRLKIELQKTSTNLAIKEDEIRDLKLIDLKDAEDTIESLEKKLADARRSSNQKDVETSETIASLQGQLTEQAAAITHFERKVDDLTQEHNKAVETLTEKLETVNQAKEELELDLREQSTKLQERHATISVMTRKNTLLEQRGRTLQSELDSTGDDLRRAKEEHEKTLAALDREINRQRTYREDEDINFQRKCAALQKDLSDSESRLLAQRDQTTELERVLEERTKLLGDMVTHNKETEEEKDRALERISELEEATDRYREEKEALSQELSELRDLSQTREDQLLEKIHDEQHLREVAEADLEDARHRLGSIRRESKDVNDLEKENMVLKDKVRRQEDYLKRKLQKEKVLRERKTRNVAATPSTRNVMATPSRIASPVKRRPIPSSIGGSTTKSCTTTFSETSSFPDEWDVNS